MIYDNLQFSIVFVFLQFKCFVDLKSLARWEVIRFVCTCKRKWDVRFKNEKSWNFSGLMWDDRLNYSKQNNWLDF